MEVIFDVSGHALPSSSPDARAGWGAVVRAGDAIAEARDGLCISCDPGAQTRSRADLRSVQWALHFVHELAHIAHPSGRCRNQRGRRGQARGNGRQRLHEGEQRKREFDPACLKVVIRTESLYVIKGMQFVTQRQKYHDLWHEMDNTSACLLGKGMHIQFEHVSNRGQGDEWNERAKQLAKGAANGEPHIDKFSRCSTCEIDFEDGFVTVATHFREMHVENCGFDKEDEGGETRVEKETVTDFGCKLCPRVLADRFALDQHMLDKHGR